MMSPAPAVRIPRNLEMETGVGGSLEADVTAFLLISEKRRFPKGI
jgi:hypothetical protein